MNHLKNILHKGGHNHEEHAATGSGAKATHDGNVLAETPSFEFLEGTIYFPIESIKDHSKVLTVTDKQYTCPWKGAARYYDVHVEGKTLKNAAWDYPEPSDAAKQIRGHVAFDRNQITTIKG